MIISFKKLLNLDLSTFENLNSRMKTEAHAFVEVEVFDISRLISSFPGNRERRCTLAVEKFKVFIKL